VIKLIPPVADPNVLVGITTADDAAVYKMSDDLAIVLTADYFTPVVDDPYDFGRIAVTNSLSDIYAMGARPAIGLNLVGFPALTLPITILEEILRGGVDQARQAGISIVGGHSIDDPEPKYGLVVLGFVNPKDVISNATAEAGDVLLLTKPIGTGIISTAIKREVATPDEIARVTEAMTTLSRAASEAMQKVGVSACTDVTGFGLLGHLHEMTSASRVGARIRLSDVPVIEGARELAAQDMTPGGTYRNLDFLERRKAVVWEGDLSELDKLLLCDAQTAGGLLISVPARKSEEMERELAQAGVRAVRIGEIVPDPESRIYVGL